MEKEELDGIVSAVTKAVGALNADTKEKGGKSAEPETFACPECGGKVGESVKYCPFCGIELEWGE